jgi:hypothetical protein
MRRIDVIIIDVKRNKIGLEKPFMAKINVKMCDREEKKRKNFISRKSINTRN